VRAIAAAAQRARCERVRDLMAGSSCPGLITVTDGCPR
jgi:hypothetical protein